LGHCEYCGNEIGYLPFKCKYCGSIYCNKHRLPENHRCTFELKHTPVVPTASRLTKPRYQEVKGSHKASDYQKIRGVQPVGRQRRATDFRKPKDFKKYLERERKYRERAQRIVQRSLRGRPQGMGGSTGEVPATTFLMIMVVICSIAALVFSLAYLTHWVNLSIYGISQFPMYVWTIFTSLFINYSNDMFGLFFLFILIFFFYNFSRSIELKYGSKFVIQLFISCAALSGVFYISIRLLLIPLGYGIIDPLIYGGTDSVGLAGGAILGLIAFIIFFDYNREMTLLCYFIPVKMKGKTLLIILILFSILPSVFNALIYMNLLYLAIGLPDLGGILGGYILFKMKTQRR